MGLAFACLVPGIDLGLQFVALGEQGFVLWSEVIDDLFRTGPELLGDDAGPGMASSLTKSYRTLAT